MPGLPGGMWQIGTVGGCGLLALALVKRNPGSVPLLRRDRDGCATHAAVLLDGQIVHLGDDETRLEPVTLNELRESCKVDFDSTRVNLCSGEIRRVVELMGLWN